VTGSQQHSALQECSHEPLLHYPNFRLEGLPPPSTTLVAAKATSFLLHSAVATMSETTSTTGSSSTSAPFANDDDDSESIGTIDENDSKGDASDFFLHQDEYSSSSLEPLPIHSSMELYHEKLYSIFWMILWLECYCTFFQTVLWVLHPPFSHTTLSRLQTNHTLPSTNFERLIFTSIQFIHANISVLQFKSRCSYNHPCYIMLLLCSH